MALTVGDDGNPYHEINVNVTSLQAWSEELHRLVGLTQAANNSVGHWLVDTFTGSGPPGAHRLKTLNADGLATLAAAVEQLDDLIARLRDAASYVASAYTESDAYARSTSDSVLAGFRGEGAGG
ncbi:MAG: hypothetical protein IRY92_06040 [Dactylosporangium sp.]|jgi:hypothetical protein|nr:hypothetical protein [Dactylosporangium sp.]